MHYQATKEIEFCIAFRVKSTTLYAFILCEGFAIPSVEKEWN